MIKKAFNNLDFSTKLMFKTNFLNFAINFKDNLVKQTKIIIGIFSFTII